MENFYSQDSTISVCKQEDQIYSKIQQQMDLDRAIAQQLQDEYDEIQFSRKR